MQFGFRLLKNDNRRLHFQGARLRMPLKMAPHHRCINNEVLHRRRRKNPNRKHKNHMPGVTRSNPAGFRLVEHPAACMGRPGK